MAKEKKDIIEDEQEPLEQTESEEPEQESAEEALKKQLSEQEDKYMRLMAEYSNYQKRTQREKDARYGDAVIDTIEAILPIADNIERALETEVESEDAKKLKEGVELVAKQISDSFTKLGISPIKALGEQFDPEYHNAIMHIEDETIDDNTVVEEFMKGYIYKDKRVVRHSMVKVAN